MTSQVCISRPQHRTAKGAQRIRDLTSVAADMFLERGFKAVAVDDLIARVGGSRRNIYSHFGGKEGLFIAAMTQVCEEISSSLEGLNIDQADPRDALRSFGCQFLDVMLEPRTLALYRLMVAEGKDFPEVSQAMYNAGPRKVIGFLAKWIEGQKKQLQLDSLKSRSSFIMADQFIFLVLGDIHLRVLVGLDSLPVPETEITQIVNNAIATLFPESHD